MDVATGACSSCGRLWRSGECLKNWDGLRSPISSSVSSWRMHCSLGGKAAVWARSSAWCTGLLRAERWWCPLLLRHTGGPSARLRRKTWSSHCWRRPRNTALRPERATWLAARPRTAGAARLLSIPLSAVSCLQPTCIVGVTNVGCRYS
jgi:hypothetical protein